MVVRSEMTNCIDEITRLYELLCRLEVAIGGKRYLNALGAASDWPARGVYFFFEDEENRTGSGDGPRLVRIGTHALTIGARSTLHQRLRQHAGTTSGKGNHRGSIFRLLIGEALTARGDCARCRSWGSKSDIGKAASALGIPKQDLAAEELQLEAAVSSYFVRLPFLWLSIDDDPGPSSLRGYIERNVIALISNYNAGSIDPPSPAWLGRFSEHGKVRRSGLWNQRHVEETSEPGFLDVMESLIDKQLQTPMRVRSRNAGQPYGQISEFEH